MTKPIIAVVDDDRSVVKSLARMLGSSGYTVKTFASAGEYLACQLECPPQCLVLDVHMPEMTGFELLDCLERNASCVPTILMTANDTPQSRERAHKAGCVGFFLKPFNNEVLLMAIEEATQCKCANDITCRDH